MWTLQKYWKPPSKIFEKHKMCYFSISKCIWNDEYFQKLLRKAEILTLNKIKQGTKRNLWLVWNHKQIFLGFLLWKNSSEDKTAKIMSCIFLVTSLKMLSLLIAIFFLGVKKKPLHQDILICIYQAIYDCFKVLLLFIT